MIKKDLHNTCIVCGKALQPEVCAKCKGTGQVKAGLLGKRACQQCGGTGQVQMCPDWRAHFGHGQPKVGWTPLGSSGGAGATPIHQTCPVCKGTKGIRMPFTGQAGPCPRCKGKGWV